MSENTGRAGGGAVEQAVAGLGDPSAETRRAAVEVLARALADGTAARGPATGWVNLHCHTFFSYNPSGWTPSQFAWLALHRGLRAAGIVDFDVLDGVDEFLETARQFGLRAAAGMECRVFIPEFSSREINSPGEPGVSYHMGIGFASSTVPAALAPFLGRLREISSGRNRQLVAKVNAYLSPANLDYEADVLPLTPKGNATERHICLAYARKARQVFGSHASLEAFWSEKLRFNAAELDLPEGPALQNRIRSVTMKAGGVGYMKPDAGSFPTLSETNRFILDAGAIPLLTWLDGTSAGEAAVDELLDLHVAGGAAGINIIPDRNFKPGVRDRKLENLLAIVEKARARDLFLVAGTEMNSPGNKFVDDFATAELKPLLADFVRGANIVHGHTMLARARAMGYVSGWSQSSFRNRAERNNFYETVGMVVEPGRPDAFDSVGVELSPGQVLEHVFCAVDRCRRL